MTFSFLSYRLAGESGVKVVCECDGTTEGNFLFMIFICGDGRAMFVQSYDNDDDDDDDTSRKYLIKLKLFFLQ